MQNPFQAAKPLVKTFMSGYYRPAAEKMSEYLAYMEKRINAVGGTKKKSRMLEQHRPYLDLDFYATSIKLLNEAEAICGTDKAALLHVQRERIPVDCGLLNMWNNLKKKLPAGKTMPFNRNAVIKRYKTICMAQIKTFYAIGKQKNTIKKLEKQLKKFKKVK